MAGRTDDRRLFRFAAGATEFGAGVRVTEIDDDIAVLDFLSNLIPEIETGSYLDIGLRRGAGNRRPHPALRSEQENADLRLHATSANASSVFRNRAWFAALISHSGSRHSADIASRHDRAVFTGTGFGSMKRSLKIGSIFMCISRALFVSPVRNAWTSATTSAGNKFEATLTTPTAPTDKNGSVNESSPLKIVNASGKRARKSLTLSTLPPASLIETMFAQSIASRSTVSGPISTAQRPGML